MRRIDSKSRLLVLLGALMFVVAGSATADALERTTVEYPPVEVLATEDIKTFFTDQGLDDDDLIFLGLQVEQIPWDVRETIDAIVEENIDDVETLVQDALDTRAGEDTGREGFLTLGSYRWWKRLPA